VARRRHIPVIQPSLLAESVSTDTIEGKADRAVAPSRPFIRIECKAAALVA
jgi:hypothetical protein